MTDLIVHEENNRTYYLIDLNLSDDGKAVHLDISGPVRDAIRNDRKRGYGFRNGPNYAIETVRALEYASYVREVADSRNYRMFGTKLYNVFVDMIPANGRATKKVSDLK